MKGMGWGAASSKSFSLAMFVISIPISLGSYFVSGEPFNSTLVVLIILTCSSLSFLPVLDYTPYERREMQAPINPDTNNEWDGVVDQYNQLNYQVSITPVRYTYHQQLAMDPCPQQ